MTEEEVRVKAKALYDQCRDECRALAEANIAVAFAGIYLEAFTSGVDYGIAHERARWQQAEAARDRTLADAFPDSDRLH